MLRSLTSMAAMLVAACGTAGAQNGGGGSASEPTWAWSRLADGSRLLTLTNPVMHIEARTRCWGRRGGWDCLRVSRFALQGEDVSFTFERLRPARLEDASLRGYAVATDPPSDAYRCHIFDGGGRRFVTHDFRSTRDVGFEPRPSRQLIARISRSNRRASLFDCGAVAAQIRTAGLNGLASPAFSLPEL